MATVQINYKYKYYKVVVIEGGELTSNTGSRLASECTHIISRIYCTIPNNIIRNVVRAIQATYQRVWIVS